MVREPRTVVLTTVDGRGRPHAAAVWYLWREGELLVATGRGSQKHRNLERSARAAVTWLDDWRYLTAEGPVAIEPLRAEDRYALWAHYRGEEVARRETANNLHEEMVLLRLRPERWWGEG
jgi:PPOX class probable F420-dependent enzyme